MRKGLQLSWEERREEEVVLTKEDVQTEREYWKHALIGYLLGDSAPFTAMKNFVYQWRDVAGSYIFLRDDGYFVYKFENKDDKQLIPLQSWFLNSRSLIFREWSSSFVMEEMLDQVPT